MSASRKLYVALAEKFKARRPRVVGTDEMRVWRGLVTDTMLVLSADNSGFDRRRFLSAAGFTDDDLMAYNDLL